MPAIKISMRQAAELIARADARLAEYLGQLDTADTGEPRERR